MGFLNKLFGRRDNIEQTYDTKTQQNLTPCKTVEELIEKYGAIVMDKQLSIGDFIGDNYWNINISNEEISFGNDIVFSIQVLGTISHSSQNWLWSWANTKVELSKNIIKQALELKKYGENNRIDLLRNDTFDFTKEDLHLMGIIASGINNSSAYYICDYGQGAMLVLLKDDRLDKAFNNNPISHLRILTVFPQLISQFEVDHKFALINYLKAKGYSVNELENRIVGTKGSDTITAEFDDQLRLTKLNG